MLHQPNSDGSILVPVLHEELTTQTFVVPREFADRLEMHALCLVEAMHDDERFDPSNQVIQAMSFIIQTAVGAYLDERPDDDIEPPQIV